MLTFSFVIPAYNEADDIAQTLEAVRSQRYPAHEIIVVDDGSTDGTQEIVRQLADRGRPITLIEHDQNRHIAAARNTGLRAATGDIVVFLDADDTVPPDFLERLVPSYWSGVDCVCVESQVEHGDTVARYIQAEHELYFGGGDWVGFSAGFSCRREAALGVLFPEELGGAEEVVFFERLMERGFSCATDFSLVIGRRFPTTISGYWKQWVARARPAPHICYFVRERPLPVVIARRVLVGARALVSTLAVLPAIFAARQRAAKSPRGLGDLPAFWFLHHVQLIASRVGEWQGVLRLMRNRKPSARTA